MTSGNATAEATETGWTVVISRHHVIHVDAPDAAAAREQARDIFAVAEEGDLEVRTDVTAVRRQGP